MRALDPRFPPSRFGGLNPAEAREASVGRVAGVSGLLGDSNEAIMRYRFSIGTSKATPGSAAG
jgi:hypothetical protein